MKGLKKIINNIDKKEFKRYGLFTILLIITLIVFGTFKFTQARYETDTQLDISPSLAFFIVDVQSSTGQIRLESMVPSSTPYLYTFNVSNFKTSSNKHANVDLTYSIEIVTTTNMPLNFRIFKGNDLQTNEIDSDTVTTDDNGVYYRHLRINDVSVMEYDEDVTDVYTLWVEFPLSCKNQPDAYAGIIDLVDIVIDAEQVV